MGAYEAQRRVTAYRRVARPADFVLAGLRSDQPVADPTDFLIQAFDASRINPLSPAGPTWDDLNATGRLGLLEPRCVSSWGIATAPVSAWSES